MKHREKVRMARRISGMQKDHFLSREWLALKDSIQKAVGKKELKQKLLAKLRKEKRKEV